MSRTLNFYSQRDPGIFRTQTFYILILVIAVVLACNSASAREVEQTTIERLSKNWIAQKPAEDKTTRTILNVNRIENTPVGITVYVARLKPRRYIVITGDTRLPPILVFSFTNDIDLSPGSQNAFHALLQQDLEQLKQHLDMTTGASSRAKVH
ncbi:hypothetical protein CCP3SC15_30054 [Gammaproteobacteria bacterium]